MPTYPEWPVNPPIDVSGSTSAQTHLDWLLDATLFTQLIHSLADASFPGDGVIARGASPYPDLKVHEQSTPTMKIEADEGLCKVNQGLYGHRAKFTSATLVAPASDNRIDIVEVNPIGRKIQITQGVVAASPSAPTVTSGYFILAEIYHRTAETSIKDSDDASNGYITDKRTYCNA